MLSAKTRAEVLSLKGVNSTGKEVRGRTQIQGKEVRERDRAGNGKRVLFGVGKIVSI
jgi:hypothetical protein